jgi:DNA-binding SARP family transcriptional activator/predicted ATPase
MARLSISLLGPLQVTLDGELIREFVTDKARALLAYLAVEADHPHQRDMLAGLLWPDQPQSRARHSLRQALSHLRRAIGDGEDDASFLHISREAVQFNSHSDCRLDVAIFARLLEASRHHRHRRLDACRSCVVRLEECVALYRGQFLAQLYVPDSTAFEEWALLKREWLHRQALDALFHLANYHERRAEYGQALEYAWRQVTFEPWGEEAHRQLMRLLALNGQRSAALAQYERCRHILQEELGVEPTSETTDLYQQIERQELLPPPPTGRNLPPQATPFIGRETELWELAELLENPDARLVTLVGPGGIGKSRLALQAAREQLGCFPDGIFFASLAAVNSADLILPTLADAVGLTFQGAQDPHAQLLDYLRGKQLLLVLDNLEHLLGEAQLLFEILRRAPGVVMLVTSRERLSLREERVYAVTGLSYPADDLEDGTSSADALDGCSAIALFLESARRADHRFELDDEQLPYVVRIARLVEGMPLALELAAAWVTVRTCQELAGEIERNLDILTSALRNVPERHQSVRAAFEHSWNLLSEQEQRIFAGLSVFQGGFDLPAAEYVTGATGRLITELRHKSLIRSDTSGRLDLHPLLRQFAAEKLAAQPQVWADWNDRHSEYYSDLLAAAQSDLFGLQTSDTLRAIRLNLENHRAAWSRAIARAKWAQIDRSVASLARYFHFRGPFQVGEALVGSAVQEIEACIKAGEVPREEGSLTLARLLIAHARLLNAHAAYDEAIGSARRALEGLRTLQTGPGPYHTDDPATASGVGDGVKRTANDGLQELTATAHLVWGQALHLKADYGAARERLAQALALAREAAAPQVEASALLALGSVIVRQGGHEEAKRYYHRALGIYQELDDRQGESEAFNNLGVADYYQGEHRTSREYFEQAFKIRRAIGDRLGEGKTLNNLGNCSADLGDYAQARILYERALKIYHELGHRRGESILLNNLSALFWAQGDYIRAWSGYQESLRKCREIGDCEGESQALSNLALLAHLRGNDARALELASQALRMARECGDRPIEAEALTRIGYALAALNRFDDALDHYTAALALRREMGLSHLAMETLAGLARLFLAQGDVGQALAPVEEILEFLQANTSETGSGNPLDGTDEPFRVYLTCYQVLVANQDARAARVLVTAHRLLQEQAAGINDERLRSSFLENISAHREIVAAFTRSQSR